MSDAPKNEQDPATADVSPEELALIQSRLDVTTFRPEVQSSGDSATMAVLGQNALSTQLIENVPKSGVTVADNAPKFEEPEGGYDTGISTQPPDASVWKAPVKGVDPTGYGTGRGEYPSGRSV